MTDTESGSEPENGGTKIGRREILVAGLGVGVGVAGAATVGSQFLQSDDEELQGPANYPVISTRDHFTTSLLGGVKRTSGVSSTDYELHGDWSTIQNADHPETTVFIHGLNVSSDEREDVNQAYATQTALKNNGYDGHVVAFSWDSDGGTWWHAKEIATRVGPKLANWTQAYLQETGGTVRYIAHSLGARVVLNSLAFLHEQAETGQRSGRHQLASVSVLGGAIPSVTPSLRRRPIERTCDQFGNFYKRNDRTLQALSIIECDAMLGQSGLPADRTAPSNYRDHDVTEQVQGHDAYFRPEEGCIPSVVESF